MLLSRVWRLSDVDRRLFCTLEYLIAQYVIEATELSLRVNNDPLYVCSILCGQRRHHASLHRHHHQASYSSFQF